MKYNKTDQDKCVECRNVTLLKTFRNGCNIADDIRNNDTTIISRTKHKLIVGSPLMTLDKLDFVANKVENSYFSKEIRK